MNDGASWEVVNGQWLGSGSEQQGSGAWLVGLAPPMSELLKLGEWL